MLRMPAKKIAAMLAMAAAVMGCGPTEGFMTREEGLWNITSQQTVRYEDDVFISDTTYMDSLGQLQFERSGAGYKLDAQGAKEEFVWSVNQKDDRMVIYFDTSPFLDAAIQGKTSDAMTLRWDHAYGQGPILVREEHTTKLKRAN